MEVDAMMAALRGPEDPGVDPGDHGQTSVTAAATASARSKTIKLSQVLPTLTRLRLLVTVGDAAISSVSVEDRRQAVSVKLHVSGVTPF